MRKQDIHAGEAYAVVGSVSYGYEREALRAVIVGPDATPGWWQVRFDEPLVRGEWQRLYPAQQRADRPASHEHVVESRCILAPWERYVLERDALLERERLWRERREQETAQIQAGLEELAQALADKGFDVSPPFYLAQGEGISHEQLSMRARVSLAPTLLDYVVAAVKAAAPPRQESAVAALLGLVGESAPACAERGTAEATV